MNKLVNVFYNEAQINNSWLFVRTFSAPILASWEMSLEEQNIQKGTEEAELILKTYPFVSSCELEPLMPPAHLRSTCFRPGCITSN